MEPEQNFANFRELISQINVTYKDCKSSLGRDPSNISKELESTYIAKLVRFARSESDVHKCLRYLEDKVPGAQDGQWIVFSWAYADILHRENGLLPPGERFRKVKEFFTFCIQHHAKNLLELHEIMMMLDHTGKMGPLTEEMVKKEAKIGSPTCTMEEIILSQAKTFGVIFPELNLIGPIAYGTAPVKQSISDFYPNLVPVKKANPGRRSIFDKKVSTPLEELKEVMYLYIHSSTGLELLPSLIKKMVGMPIFSLMGKDPVITICEMLDEMCKRVLPEQHSVVALVLLWVYVGALERRRMFDPVKSVNLVDTRLEGVFKITVGQDKHENREHIINLWNAILYLSPRMSEFPITSAFLRQTYPDLDLHLGQDRVSYKPHKFFGTMVRRNDRGQEKVATFPEVVTSSLAQGFHQSTRNNSPPPVPNVTPVLELGEESGHETDKKSKELIDLTNSSVKNDPNMDVDFGSQNPTVRSAQNSSPSEQINVNLGPGLQADVKGSGPRDEPDLRGLGSHGEFDLNGSGPRDELDLSGSSPRNDQCVTGSDQPDVKGSLPSPSDSDVLLFVTDPYAKIRLNPSLFPSEGGGWSASTLLPVEKRKMSEKKGDDLPDPQQPLPVLPPTAPEGCTETLLGIDFTPDEYLEQTIAYNYYAQGIKLVDGVRRVVFYHKDNFSSVFNS
ncbi:uncharacterized protein LOC118439472 [Folsomia candida]|uniref:Uncharacterized protein n=1 Tax=Folsomia candida TaxID=158441 RepID=A0A226D3X9_FOLCA|nr:uncharacterized protein LOC118439472 [Folsomia candida]OXA39883.1 hypothetical protein Fcan01_25314 [Folsomia candida]